MGARVDLRDKEAVRRALDEPMSATIDASLLLYASDETSQFHPRALGFLEQLARGPSLVYLLDAAASGNLVPDAHVVSLMRENGVRTIWTNDRDFRRFSSLDVRDPFASS